MIPSEIFAEDLMNTVIRYGLYLGAAFQIICLLACVTLTDEQSEPIVIYEKPFTDSDDCSSEQSSPGRSSTRSRRQDKNKKRR